MMMLAEVELLFARRYLSHEKESNCYLAVSHNVCNRSFRRRRCLHPCHHLSSSLSPSPWLQTDGRGVTGLGREGVRRLSLLPTATVTAKDARDAADGRTYLCL